MWKNNTKMRKTKEEWERRVRKLQKFEERTFYIAEKYRAYKIPSMNAGKWSGDIPPWSGFGIWQMDTLEGKPGNRIEAVFNHREKPEGFTRIVDYIEDETFEGYCDQFGFMVGKGIVRVTSTGEIKQQGIFKGEEFTAEEVDLSAEV